MAAFTALAQRPSLPLVTPPADLDRRAPHARSAFHSRAVDEQQSFAGLAVGLGGIAAGVTFRKARAFTRRGQRAVLQASADGSQPGTGYVNVTGFPFPLGPILARRTVRTEIGDGMWTFEQEQSLANIAVNVRMTAIRLDDGSLWIHNPIAPTEECIGLVKDLGCPVKYIVLGSAQYEHKIFVSPFARRWPEAKVYTVPELWSWPIDLPSALLGIFSAGDLKDADADTPWAAEIDQRLLLPKNRLGFGYSASECAFFHRRSKTLICTDALVFVPEEPPAVLDRRELTALGKTADNIVLDLVALTNWRGSGDAVRKAKEEESSSPLSEADLLKKGWHRDALLSLFFGPDGQSIIEPSQAFRAVAGRWIVGPVCYSLVYGGMIREDVKEWSEKICEWDVQQILPGHFAGPVSGNKDDIRRAFEVLDANVDATKEPENALPWPFPQPVRYRKEDIQLLTDLRGVLQTLKVI
eukprot:TRINITY_DN40828_c0_g1_i1.p1 TRINITY_DN40828_c0_g1~~TRINITY_DN40828_c0_g1_i1.p1  ORF type:complete len:468 (+),score=101.75 TRINITY_DN40828_c0_g1_i1:108-1511(+)